MSLRLRLTILVVATLAVALGVVFGATYRGTGQEVRRQIDQDLQQDLTTINLQGLPITATSPRDTAQAVRDYVGAQPSFGAFARLYVVRVVHGPVITNEPELVGLANPLGTQLTRAQQAARARIARSLLRARLGYTTFPNTSVGPIRMLVAPIQRGGRTVAYVGIGESMSAVDRARAGVARTFGLAGAVALAIALIGGYLVAARTSRPLRRMARAAAQVDAGDLTPRIRAQGPRDEVQVLADAFDRMLDRLSDAFARQRGFVSDASHELRTPLTVVRGQLEVLARQPQVTIEDVRRVEGMVRAEIVRMERLVEDLLLLARADEGQLVRPETIDVDGFLEELWDGLSLMGPRDFRLGPLPGGTLRADPDRLAQVLSNLARNAVEHTEPAGLVRLTATAREDRLELAVDDDGPGIPPEHRDRVFDRFHRTDHGRARSAGGGAGLGLAIARAIAEAHGGTIAAERSPEGGARIVVTLPGYSPPAPEPPPRRRAAARAG